jgi:lipopolysaccharide cholinephosphotransferase
MKKELMKKYDTDELKKLQQIELEILKEVLKICRKADIDCFLWGGTAIGAERHGGFIPWDDDVDVIMLRDDYDKFLETAPKLLPKNLFLQNHNTDRNYPGYFTKIRKNDTIFLEKYAMHKKMHHGIFIDVFVLDAVPENIRERRLFFIKNRFLVQLYLAKHLTASFTANVNPLKIFIRKLLHFVLIPISADFLYRKLDKHVRKYHASRSNYLHQSGRDHKTPYIYTKSEFSDKRKITFESVEAYVPVGNHDVLTYRYGDYMKIPPVEARYNHRPVKIEFDGPDSHKIHTLQNNTPRVRSPVRGGTSGRLN